MSDIVIVVNVTISIPLDLDCLYDVRLKHDFFATFEFFYTLRRNMEELSTGATLSWLSITTISL